MAMNNDTTLAAVIAKIARRHRAGATLRVIAVWLVAVVVAFVLVVWADAKFDFSGWTLAVIDASAVAISVSFWVWLKSSQRAARKNEVSWALQLEAVHQLHNSELTNAVELRQDDAGDSAALRARAVETGNKLAANLRLDEIAPLWPLRLSAVVLMIALSGLMAVSVVWPAQARSAGLRLLCPWSDAPSFSAIKFSATWNSQEPRVVTVSTVVAVGSRPAMADLVWVHRNWWGGLGDEIARMPLSPMADGTFEGALHGQPASAEYFIVTSLGRSTVFALPKFERPAPREDPVAASPTSAPKTGISPSDSKSLAEAADAVQREVEAILALWQKHQKSGDLRDQLRAAGRKADAVARQAREQRDDDLVAPLELSAMELAVGLRRIAEEVSGELTTPMQGESDVSAKLAEARMDAVGKWIAALQAANHRLKQGPPDAVVGAPSRGTGNGDGAGTGAGLSVESSGYSVRGNDGGVVAASATQPLDRAGDPSPSLMGIAPRYREVAADYLDRLARDRAAREKINPR